jgi:hypothetical protein
MAKFEYHLLPVGESFLNANRGGDAKETLNTFGRDGWDIAAVIPSTKPGETTLILRREMSD